jgi:parallel beta-helix repeat protein
MDTKSSTSSRTHEDVEGQPVAKKTRLVLKTIIYDESRPNQWLDDPPLAVWDHMIIPFLSLRDLALSRHVCTFFEAYWQDKFDNNVLPLRVGNDVATFNDVMGVIEILSRRREYTKASPFVVLLGKGDHQITSSWSPPGVSEQQTTLGITCSNITVIGKGIGETFILGGFGVANVQNITLKQMTVTNTKGIGILMYGGQVELVDVATVHCRSSGINVNPDPNIGSSSAGPSQLVLTRCEMSNNGAAGLYISNSNNNILQNVCLKNCISHHNSNGIYASGKAVVHVYGEATKIHSNSTYGIAAYVSGKVVIHLPSHHNTSYNNGHGDRKTTSGGTITNVED